MNKKKQVLAFILLALLFLISNVIAYSHYSSSPFGIDIRRGSEDAINFIVNWAEPFLIAVLGGYDYSGILIFEKFLFFILLLSLIYIALNNVPIFDDQKRIVIIVSVIASILSVRFIDLVWLNTIILQYQILGISITSILPFIIFLFFLHTVSESPVVRKIGWIFFILVYYGLWATVETENYGQVYFWTMIVSILFLLFDGTIHKAILKQRLNESNYNTSYDAIADLEERLDSIRHSTKIPARIKQRLIKKIEKEILWWQRRI